MSKVLSIYKNSIEFGDARIVGGDKGTGDMGELGGGI